jgi:hypothetical protein
MPAILPCWIVVRPIIAMATRVVHRAPRPRIFVTPHKAERVIRRRVWHAVKAGVSISVVCGAGAGAPFLLPGIPWGGSPSGGASVPFGGIPGGSAGFIPGGGGSIGGGSGGGFTPGGGNGLPGGVTTTERPHHPCAPINISEPSTALILSAALIALTLVRCVTKAKRSI